MYLQVLSYWEDVSLLLFVPTKDRDYTDSRRIEPNSRTTLIDEQSNPSQLVHQEDVMSRHRGAKQRLRYELFRAISLLCLA